MNWKEISSDQRFIDSAPVEQARIKEDWFRNTIKSDPRFKPELETKIRADLFGTEISAGKPKSFLESIFKKSPEDEIAKSQNIYTIAQTTGKPIQDVEKNYDREKVRFINPPESFTPEDKTRRVLDQGFARGLIGTKSVYPEFDAEHPVLSAIGEGAGNLAGLIATGETLKVLGIGGAVYKSIVGKFGLGAIPIAKTAAKVIETGITFGTKTAAEKLVQLQNHEDITLKSGKEILDSTLFGMGLGAVGSIAKPLARIPGEMIYGYTTAKMQGADNLNATINAAVFGIFGLTNLSDYSKEYKISAINKVTETVAKKAEGFGLAPAEAQRQAKSFVEGNVLKTTGETDITKAWDKVLTSKEYNLKYFDNINESMKSLERASPKLAEQGMPVKSPEITPEQQTALENTFKDELDKELAKVINPEALKAAEAAKTPIPSDLAQQVPVVSIKDAVTAGETPAPVVEPPNAKNEIITDPARIQEIKNSISEGEMILKSGKTVSGKKMSAEELSVVKTSVDNAKDKIGTALEAKNISSVIEKSGGVNVKIVPLKDSMLMDKDGNPEQMVQFDDAKGSTHILRISEVTPENVKVKVGQSTPTGQKNNLSFVPRKVGGVKDIVSNGKSVGEIAYRMEGGTAADFDIKIFKDNRRQGLATSAIAKVFNEGATSITGSLTGEDSKTATAFWKSIGANVYGGQVGLNKERFLESTNKAKEGNKIITQKETVKQSVSKEPKTLKAVAEETGILEPNVRRILGVGAKDGTFTRVDKGVYVLNKDGQDIAYIHPGDALEILPKLAREGFKADMVFLDIPYKTPAVTGGNRGIKYDYITPEEFNKVVIPVSIILRDENTPVIYMYSQARSGLKEMQKYTDVLLSAGFKPIAKGEYTKLQKDGVTRVRNMRGDIIEPEGIILFTYSGKFDKEIPNLNFKLIRPKGYQTEKPAEMLKALIETTTEKGDVVLDPFAGSGVTGAEAIKSGRTAALIEKNPKVAEEVIKPRLEEAAKKREIKYIQLNLSKEDKDILLKIKEEVSGAQAGYKYVTRDEISGDVVKAGYEPGDFEFIKYWPKGWAKEPTFKIIDKAIEKNQLTEKQKVIVDLLLSNFKEVADEERTLAAEGVSQSEIKEVDGIAKEEVERSFEIVRNEVSKLSTQDLEKLIDSKYEAGSPQETLELLETLYDARISEGESSIDKGEGAGLEEQLINMYHRYINPELRQGMEVKDILGNMRSALETYGFSAGGLKENVTDDEILAAAKELYLDKQDLIKKQKGEGRNEILDAYRKAILPEYNTSKEIIEVDALVDKIRELNPKDESDAMWIKEGNKFESTVSYPHSLGENGNQTTFIYKDKPTIAEIKQDVLQEYKDFKKEVNEELVMGVVAKSGRDENIEEAIDKVLAVVSNITPSGQIREELHAPLVKDLFQEEGELFKKPKLDITKEKDYTLGEQEKAYGTIEKAQEEREKAWNDISNIQPTGSALSAQQRISKIAQELKDRGFIDFRGKQVNNIQEIAEIVSAFRHPKIEQFQVLFLKENTVVAHQVFTSGQPDTAYFGEKLVPHINQISLRLEADSVFFIHNHPSGNSDPSSLDLETTILLEKAIGPVFKGHIVTNGNDFSLIEADIFKNTTNVEKFAYSKENYKEGFNKLEPHGGNKGLFAKIGKDFVKEGKAAVIFLGNQLHILSVDNIGIQKNIGQYIKESKIKYGATVYIITYNAGDTINLPEKLPSGFLDIIRINKDKTYQSYQDNNKGLLPGGINKRVEKDKFPDKVFRIQEEQIPFGKQSILWGNNIPVEQGVEYSKLKSLEMPELVRLARELTGLYPTVVKKTGNAAGRFYSKNGQIKLIAELFQQGKEQELAIVLAHEIGHLVDWLPDNTLKRGNLLGRLLSLRSYLKQTFGELTNKEIKDELIKVTQYMHPFDPKGVPPSYLQYRLSPRELYAEAISLLLNSPGTIEKMAPQFTKAFFENLDKKLDVKEAYFDMLELLNGERSNVLDALDQDIRRMFAKADPLRAQKMTEKKIATVSMFERLRQFVDNKYRPIIKKVENLEKLGTIFSPDKNPKYILEEYAMANNKIYEWCLKLDTDVKKELDLAELTEIDFGVYVFLKRIIGRPAEVVEESQEFDEEEIKQFANQFTDRKDMANPLGVDPKRAQEQLDFLKNKLGEDKFVKLEQAADNFHKLVFEVVEEAVKVGSYNQKTFKERIEPNKDTYVSFGVINYMQNFVSAGVKKQMGTLGEIENPFITTVLKTVSLIKLNEKQRAINSIRDMLKTNFSDEIKESKFIQKEGLRVFIDTPGSGRMQLLEDGRMASYDVDPYIAKSLEYDSTETSHEIGKLISTIFGNNMFKQLYITYNPGFAFAFNPIRDFKRTYKNLQAMGRGVTIRALLVEYAKNLPTTYRRLRGISDELITEMIGNRALEINFDDFIEAYTDKSLSYNEILKRYGLAKNNDEVRSLRKTLLKPIVKVLEFIRFHGAALESISKISGYNILKKKDVCPAERAYITRNYIGTPNFRNKGLVTDTTNAVWMFSNIIKEGFKSDMYLATNPKTRSGYWWATAKLDLLPKLLMVLAGAGLFGVKIKELMDKASEYDKTNYIIIPIGEHKGKAAYLRIPHDETGRLMAALFYKIANTLQGKPEQLQQIFSFGAGQLPNLAPGIQIATGWMTYLQGQNPYDNFRGRTIISDTDWKAGGWNSLKKMIEWTVNQSGQVSFATYSKDSNSTFESIAQLTPIINRLLKISDYGVTEELKQIKEDVQKVNARETLLKREEFKKGAQLIEKGTDAIEVLKGIKKSVYGNQNITSKEANILLKGLARETLKHKEDDPFVDALIYSNSNDEKKRIIIKMRSKMPLVEFKDTLKTLYKFKIFSDEVMTGDEWKKVLRAD